MKFSFSFTATVEMTALDFLEFAPIVTAGTGTAYPGLDMVSLEAIKGAPVPEPSTVLLFGIGLLGLTGFNRKK